MKNGYSATNLIRYSNKGANQNGIMKLLTIQQGRLPRGWRERICESLNNQGFQIDPQKLSDVLRGRYADDILTNKAIREYNKAIKKSQKRKSVLKLKTR